MFIKVLGSAAGGGLPQWNCNGRNSRDVRADAGGLAPRTQSSIAVSIDAKAWVLFNASPDIRQQINQTPELQPCRDMGPRNSPIAAVVLTNGDVDHVAGLLSLREGQAFELYAARRVLNSLNANTIFNVLNPKIVGRNEIVFDQAFDVCGPDGSTGVRAEVFAVPGKIALYLEDLQAGAEGNYGSEAGDTVGVKITDRNTDAHFFYIPGCAHLNDPLRARLRNAALVMFDGTLFTNDEMIEQSLSTKTGSRMGHMNMSGPDGSIAAFDDLGVKRRIFIHINNSNSALREGSEEHAFVMNSGWELAYDGMEVRL